MIPFRDAEKAAKLEEAIRRGYIIRHQYQDGMLGYELTQLGAQKWMLERMGIM